MTANDIEASHREAAYFLVFQFWILDTSCLAADNVKVVSF